MTENAGLVLFGDVVGSRRDSVGSTAWLRDLVSELDEAYGEQRLAPFEFTQGDELQGLLSADADPLAAVLRAALGPAAAAVPLAIAAKAARARNKPRAAQRTRDVDLREGLCIGEFMSAHRVVATATPRVAASDSTHSHPAPSKQTVLGDGLLGVERAGRLITTDRRAPGKQAAVEPDEPDADRFHVTVFSPRTPPRRRRLCRTPVSVWKSAPTTGDRAMIRTSQPGWNEGAITLSASRSRLRTRFRTTAPPSLRPVDRPKRVSPRPVLRIRTTRRG